MALSAFTPAPPPPWTLDFLSKLLRTEWRSRRGDDPERWPQRLSRWREERG